MPVFIHLPLVGNYAYYSSAICQYNGTECYSDVNLICFHFWDSGECGAYLRGNSQEEIG